MKNLIKIALLCFIVLYSEEAFAISPDIKVNNSDGSVIISTTDTLSVTVSLNAEGSSNTADWWVLANTPFGWYYYNIATWLSGQIVTYQGSLFNLNTYTVLTISGLPAGTYTFYFGVDTNMNGSVDTGAGQLYYDSVVVNVLSESTLPPGTVTANIAGFLELVLTDVQNRLSDLETASEGQISSSEIRSALENARAQFGLLKTKIRAAIADPSKTETIGEVAGIPFKLDQETLRFTDQWLVTAIDNILANLEGTSFNVASDYAGASTAPCTDDPELCNLLKTWKLTDTGEVVSSQMYGQLLLPSARDKVALLSKEFAAYAASLGAIIATLEISVPGLALAYLAYPAVAFTTFVFQVDGVILHVNPDDKETAKNLLEDFQGFWENMLNGTISPLLGVISKQSGIIFDLYNGWKSLVAEKLKSFVDAAKQYLENLGTPTTLTWIFSASASGGVFSGGCTKTFTLPYEGGGGSFVCDISTVTASVSVPGSFVVGGFGSGGVLGWSCSGNGGGSSVISESETAFSAGGSISGTTTCIDPDGNTQVFSISGSFSATAPK